MITEKIYATFEDMMYKPLKPEIAKKLTGGDEVGFNMIIDNIIKDKADESLKSKCIANIEQLKRVLPLIEDDSQTLYYWLEYEVPQTQYEELNEDFFNKLFVNYKHENIETVDYYTESINKLFAGVYEGKSLINRYIEVSDNFKDVKVVIPEFKKYSKSEIVINLSTYPFLIMNLTKKKRSRKINKKDDLILQALNVLTKNREIKQEGIIVHNVEQEITNNEVFLLFSIFGKAFRFEVTDKNMLHVEDTFNIIDGKGLVTNCVTKKEIPVWIIWEKR